MNFIIKLATFALLMLLLTICPAFATPIKTGSYEASHGDMSLFILLNEDGSGFFEGESQNGLAWKQMGSELIMKMYGEEGSSEFETYKATVLSSNSFDLGGAKYMNTEQTATQVDSSPRAIE